MNYKILKWTIIIFCTVFLIGIISIVYFSYNSNKFYELREYLNPNSIKINATNNLDFNKVNIYWNSDFNSGQIIKNGKNTNLVFKEHGTNRFIVLYEKDTIKEFIYYKRNNWHGHKHSFSLSKGINDSIEVEIEVIGYDIN